MKLLCCLLAYCLLTTGVLAKGPERTVTQAMFGCKDASILEHVFDVMLEDMNVGRNQLVGLVVIGQCRGFTKGDKVNIWDFQANIRLGKLASVSSVPDQNRTVLEQPSFWVPAAFLSKGEPR